MKLRAALLAAHNRSHRHVHKNSEPCWRVQPFLRSRLPSLSSLFSSIVPDLPYPGTSSTTATVPRRSIAKVRCNRRLHTYANRKLRSSKLFGRSGPTYTPYHTYDGGEMTSIFKLSERREEMREKTTFHSRLPPQSID